MSPDIKGRGSHQKKNKAKGEVWAQSYPYNNVGMEILIIGENDI